MLSEYVAAWEPPELSTDDRLENDSTCASLGLGSLDGEDVSVREKLPELSTEDRLENDSSSCASLGLGSLDSEDPQKELSVPTSPIVNVLETGHIPATRCEFDGAHIHVECDSSADHGGPHEQSPSTSHGSEHPSDIPKSPQIKKCATSEAVSLDDSLHSPLITPFKKYSSTSHASEYPSEILRSPQISECATAEAVSLNESLYSPLISPLKSPSTSHVSEHPSEILRSPQNSESATAEAVSLNKFLYSPLKSPFKQSPSTSHVSEHPSEISKSPQVSESAPAAITKADSLDEFVCSPPTSPQNSRDESRGDVQTMRDAKMDVNAHSMHLVERLQGAAQRRKLNLARAKVITRVSPPKETKQPLTSLETQRHRSTVQYYQSDSTNESEGPNPYRPFQARKAPSTTRLVNPKTAVAGLKRTHPTIPISPQLGRARKDTPVVPNTRMKTKERSHHTKYKRKASITDHDVSHRRTRTNSLKGLYFVTSESPITTTDKVPDKQTVPKTATQGKANVLNYGHHSSARAEQRTQFDASVASHTKDRAAKRVQHRERLIKEQYAKLQKMKASLR